MSDTGDFAQRNGLEIAIVGMACRFPGAGNVAQFWRNLCDGVESVTFFTDEELMAAGVDAKTLESPDYVKARGIIKDVDKFDAALFGIHPREAEIMDPQQRIFLECAWEALENACYDPEKYEGYIGVYAGVGRNSYLMNLFSNPGLLESVGGLLAGISNEKDHLTTRVAYKLGLRGPSITVQTACSTSLVAVSLACQGLLSGACDMALAGGVTVSLPEERGYNYQEGGIESPDGHCRAFDAKAKGCVGGNGAGIVVLKRLEDALADRDNIHAIIKGSAINNDGSLKVGYTAPGLEGQRQVIEAAQQLAEVAPETIGYIETHGTGTPLGDPIEIAALTQAFRTHTSEKQFCAIGSVKTNIGHLDSAAGAAGLIKTTLAVKHNLIPASLHYKTANPEIDFKNSPFYVNDRLEKWKEGRKRRAGVSSFGIGGTNAHVIIEEAGVVEESHSSRRGFILPISANTSSALEALRHRLSEYLDSSSEVSLHDVAFSLQVGRRELPYRGFVVSKSISEAAKSLLEVKTDREASTRPVCFLFPGQGNQFVNAGQDLYHTEPVFRNVLDRCLEQLSKLTGVDLLSVLYPAKGKEAEAEALIVETHVTQSILFALEYAMARQLIEWGIKPNKLIGHSLGEIVAATVAGIFSEEDALKLVAVRAEAMSRQPRGAMLAVRLSEENLRAILPKEISVAAVNASDTCVISGREAAIKEMQARLESMGVGSKLLETSHAFHSPMMDKAVKVVELEVSKITMNEPKIDIVSNVTGKKLERGEAVTASYWGRQMRETVRFEAGIEELLKDGKAIFVEVGPGRSLTSMLKKHPERKADQEFIRTMRERKEKADEDLLLMEAVGQMWQRGVAVDWTKFNKEENAKRVEIPTYPFERKRYWVDVKEADGKKRKATKKKAAKDRYYVPVWKQSVRRDRSENKAKDRWLLIADEVGIGERLREKLESSGDDVTMARVRKHYRRVSDTEVEIGKDGADYQRMIDELNAEERRPTRIVHLLGIGETNESSDNHSAKESYRERGFDSLLFLAQALGTRSLAHSQENGQTEDMLQIAVVTSGAQKLTSDETSIPEKALVLGPCRVMPLEYPGVTCRNIDIPMPPNGAYAVEETADFLVKEITSSSTDLLILYRGGDRWVQAYDPVRMEGSPGLPPLLRYGGVYLITGGMGGVGFALAEYLAKEATAKLILVGRSAFPEREKWDQWLQEHDDRDDSSLKIRKIRELEHSGSEVLVFSADITDEALMRSVVGEARKRFGSINGVIHAAGAPPSGLMQRKTREAAAIVLAAKVEGARILTTVFEDSPLDFIIYCSSLRAIAPAPGMSDYCAANIFLDASAQRARNGRGPLTISINWDGWTEVGMGVKNTSYPIAEDSANEGLTTDEGVQAFNSILWNHFPQVFVSTQPIETVIEYNADFTASKALKELEKSQLSRDAHARPQLATPYVEPTNESERGLVGIWQNLLGIAPIGINDNFFELGGDSIISLQVIAKANQLGIRLTPGQVFEYQTIAELAAAAGKGAVIRAEQGLVTGAVPLTPIQKWFFEEEFPDPHHWNQSYLFEIKENLDPLLAEKAVERLLAHHDALRLRFLRDQSGWQQSNAGLESSDFFIEINLSHLKDTEQLEALEKECARFQASLDLAQGPVVRFVLFRFGDDKPGRLLIVIHHLAIDAVSWRILMDDFYVAYRQLSRGENIELMPKTTSFKYWAEKLSEYTRSEELLDELDHWTSPSFARVSSLPVDYTDAANTVESARTITLSLSVDETRNLIHEVPQAYNTRINEVLLTALARSFERWTGAQSLLLGLESHGRENIFEDIELSRTVGWFTAFYPVLLDLEGTYDSIGALKAVKEQMRSIPRRGIGYGLLRYMSGSDEVVKQLSSLPQPEIGFLYLGQYDQDMVEVSLLRPARESFGPLRNAQAHRSLLLEITGHVAGGQFQVNWVYSENVHNRRTIENLAQDYIEELKSLIAECLSSGAGIYTPSDFPEAGFTQADLDEIIAELSEFEE